MLTQEEVKKYAHMRRLKLIDQIWKDYLQDLLLHLLYRKMPKMVFGGGTCIWKVMKGDRFSEDIDAYASQIPEDLSNYLEKELALFGVTCRAIKKKKTSNMFFLKTALSFPSHPREIIVSVEIFSGKQVKSQATVLYPPYPDIPPIEILALSSEEMLANKVSAIYGRDKARDVHDTYLLLKSGTKINMALVKKKVPKFKLGMFEKKIAEKSSLWKGLEPLIVTKLPAFKEEREFILSCFARTDTIP